MCKFLVQVDLYVFLELVLGAFSFFLSALYTFLMTWSPTPQCSDKNCAIIHEWKAIHEVTDINTNLLKFPVKHM